MAVHDIVVVGASFAGLSTAHYLLRHTIPKLEASNSGQTYKLTLISTTKRFFFKVGSPRTVASPDLIPVDKLLLPIADAFKEYPADHFKLVIGSATGLDEGRKTVSVNGANGSLTIPYATLVISTGSRTASPLWTLQDSYQETDAELKKVHAALQKASSVLIAGGGPAGVETAGTVTPYIPTIPANPLQARLRTPTRNIKSPSSAAAPASSLASAQPLASLPNLSSQNSALPQSTILESYRPTQSARRRLSTFRTAPPSL